MPISSSPSINPLRLERDLMPERLARTVCEIDPSPRSPFAVAVVLEVLGYSDRLARDAGWVDVFALARDVFDRIEFLGTADAGSARPEQTQPAAPVASSPITSVVAQQAVWLVMVVLMLAWGRSLWSADHVPSGIAQALAVGVLASLIVSGGFQYAITRRFIFHTAQRDLQQAQAFLHRALWAGGAVMSAGALVVAGVMWRMAPQDPLAPLVAGSYFLLHGNYRVAVVPLIALNDVVGIVLSTGIGVGLLALTYAGLPYGGADATTAIVGAQLVGMTALWVGSLARTRSLLGGVRASVPQGAELAAPRGARDLARTRWFILCLDAAPWFATGIGVSLVVLTFARLLHGGGAAMAIVGAQLVGLTALWLGNPARTRSLLAGARISVSQGVEPGTACGPRDRARARWFALVLDATPWFATGIGVSLVALTYARLLRIGANGTVAIVCAQLAGLIALWLGNLARTRPLLGGARIGVEQVELEAPRGARDLGPARWVVLCLDAAPWFATGVLYYLFLFATRPIVWVLPAADRLVYESGVDLGILGIVPIAIASSWGLHRYYQELRGELMHTAVLDVVEFRARAARRFSRILRRCRWFGAAIALGLVAVTQGAPWGTMNPETFSVFRITVVGLTVALPGFLFAFGLMTSLGALWDASGVLVCGLVLQVGAGLFMAQRGTAGWLALALVGSAAVLSELAVWRAKRIVRDIDRHYYAAY